MRCAAVALCRVQSAILALWLQSATSTLRNFTPVVCKVFLQYFLSILFAPPTKITNRSFWPSCDQMVLLTGVRPKPGFGHFEMRPWVKFLKFWPGETLDLYANGPKSFPPGFFTPFWCPNAGNYKSVFLTGMRQKSMFGLFDRCATRKGLKESVTNGGLMVSCHYLYFLIKCWLQFWLWVSSLVTLRSMQNFHNLPNGNLPSSQP